MPEAAKPVDKLLQWKEEGDERKSGKQNKKSLK